jgi:hypothetical protein
VENGLEQDENSRYWDQMPNEIGQDDNISYLHRFETIHGVVRDARRIESQLLGLVITKENFATLKNSFDKDRDGRNMVGEVLQALKARALLLPNRNALDKMESMWTGISRPNYGDEMEDAGERESIYVQFGVSYFIDHEWNQVRQLNYLAITKTVIPDLLDYADPRGRPQYSIPDSAFFPEMTRKSLSLAIQCLLNRAVQQDFTAALRRKVYFFQDSDVETVSRDGNGMLRVSLAPKLEAKPDNHRNSPRELLQRLVHTTHERFRIGYLDIPQPFLVKSSRVDFDTRILWDGYTKGDSLPKNKQNWSKVLVYSAPPDVRPHLLPSEQRLCLFIMDGSVTKQSDDSIIIKSLSDSGTQKFMYATSRKDCVGMLSPSSHDNRTTHLLEDSDLKDHFVVSSNDLRKSVQAWFQVLEKRMMKRATDKQ